MRSIDRSRRGVGHAAGHALVGAGTVLVSLLALGDRLGEVGADATAATGTGTGTGTAIAAEHDCPVCVAARAWRRDHPGAGLDALPFGALEAARVAAVPADAPYYRAGVAGRLD